MQVIRHLLIFIFFLTAFVVQAHLPDSLINIINIKSTDFKSVDITNNKKESKYKYKEPNWLLINNDEKNNEYGTRDENNYSIVNSHSGIVIGVNTKKGIFDTNFNGIAWYKCYFKMPLNQINKVYQIEFALQGAVEIYLDGKLQKKIGKISNNLNEVEELSVADGDFSFPINDTLVHCISIRYGLQNFKEYKQKYADYIQEPTFQFSNSEIKDNSRTVLSIYYSITNMISAFFFSLFIIHFLIYFFYRKQSFNLLYSLFLILLSLTFLEAYLIQFIENLRFYFWLDNIDDVIFPTVCFILVTLLNRLLNEKRSWHYVFLLVLLVYHYIDVIFIREFNGFTKVTIIMYTYFNTLAHSIMGVRRKITSAKFLGWGILMCTISIVILIFLTLTVTLIDSELNENTGMLFIYGLLIVSSILSIPISMSAYLAYDFASTNRSLSDKLIEVEELSAKNIEQEKEKQKILAEQNSMLETQVKERTKEIEEQKKLIEEKNKDITDSINYAQRIQRSILPSEKEIKDIFPNSFVLFKPRDIVSGDFYQFKKVNDHKFAIMADCTGHGVPGALMSMIGSNLLHQIIVERNILQPNLILSELHKEVKSTLRQTSGAQSHDGMDSSIALLLNNKLYIASANRPVYLIMNKELTEIKPTKRSIGGSSSDDHVEFEIHEFDVIKDQMLYMFSDGYADQFGGEAGKKFKLKNLASLLMSNSEMPLDMQLTTLDRSFTEWRGLLEQVDDVCVIGIRF